jgi:FK506-binding nuclear protein
MLKILYPQIRITMAAIDPTEDIADDEEEGAPPQRPRSTLKLIKTRVGDSDIDEDDEEDDEALRRMLGIGSDEDEDDDDEEEAEVNGGPSEPSKSKKTKRANGIKELIEATKDASDSDEEMKEADAKANGVKSSKGKGKASDEDEEDSEEEEDDSDDDDLEGLDLEQFVVCTLDPESVSVSVLFRHRGIADPFAALSADPRPHRLRGRESLFCCLWHSYRTSDRKLRDRRV